LNERAALERAVASGRISAAEAQAALAKGTAADLLHRLGVAQRIGPYEVIRELARGGMGAVYVARRPGLDRQVALKLLHGGAHADEDMIERFRREARVSARLRHPNIVAIHDVGQDGLNHYLVMDLIEGESLMQRLKRQGPLEPRLGATLGQSLAEALAYAHRGAVLHRDLKPHNVLLDAAGQAYLTDFGLAKDVEGGASLTQSGAIMGTPAYMPPEQAEGEVDLVDRRSDVYGLGATLYHALTGRTPFTGASAINVLNAVVSQTPPAPRSLRPEIPRDLETILLTCLAKEPAERYPSAQALAEDLGRFLAGHPIEARPPSLGDRAAKWIGRNRVLASSLALLALGLTLAPLGVTAWTAQAADDARAALRESTRDAFRAATAEVTSETSESSLVDAQDALLAAERWHALDPSDAEAQAGMGLALRGVIRILIARNEWPQAQRALKTAGRRTGMTETAGRLQAELDAALAAGLAKDLAEIDRVTQAGVPRPERVQLGLALTRASSRARVELFARELERASEVVARLTRELVTPRATQGGEPTLAARWTGPGLIELSAQDRSALISDAQFLARGPKIQAALARELPGEPLIRLRFLCELLGRSASAHPDLAVPALARFTRLAWSEESARIGFVALAQAGTPAARGAYLTAYRLYNGSWATLTSARRFADAFGAGEDIYELESSPNELFARAQTNIHAGQRDPAALFDGIALAHEARERYPESLRSLSLLVESWQAAGIPSEGREAAETAQRLAPHSARAALQISTTRAEDLRGMISDLTRALSIDPNNWTALRHRGEQNVIVGRLQQALDDAERLVREQPDQLAGHLTKANALLELRRMDDGERVIRAALKRWPASPHLHRSLARVTANRGDARGTEDALRSAGRWTLAPYVRWILQGHDDQEILALGTSAYLATLDRHEAGLVLEKVALAQVNTGDLRGARRSLDQVLRFRPELARAFIFRGGLLAKAGELRAAAIDYTRVLSREPHRELLRHMRMRMVYRLRAREMVLRDAQILSRSRALPAKSRGEAEFLGAQVALSLERDEVAEGLAKSALKDAPEIVGAHAVLGAIAERRGDQAQALQRYRKFLGSVPREHPRYREVQGRVRALESR